MLKTKNGKLPTVISQVDCYDLLLDDDKNPYFVKLDQKVEFDPANLTERERKSFEESHIVGLIAVRGLFIRDYMKLVVSYQAPKMRFDKNLFHFWLAADSYTDGHDDFFVGGLYPA